MQARFAYFALYAYTRACACRRGEVGGAGTAACNGLDTWGSLKRCFSQMTMQPTPWPKKKSLAQHMLHISVLKIYQETINRRWSFAFTRGKQACSEMLHKHRIHGSEICSKVRQMISNALELIPTLKPSEIVKVKGVLAIPGAIN